MSNYIYFAVWAVISLGLYKLTELFLTDRHHRSAAKRLGCKPAYRFKEFDIEGVRNVSRVIKADKEGRILDYLKSRIDTACAEEGKVVTTFSQDILGMRTVFTVNPKNIQAILATQFKDFGLGERRNNNLSPLLGQGIVSVSTKTNGVMNFIE